MIEHHPNDSRTKISEDNVCQSLTGRMGTGGGQYSYCSCYRKTRRAQSRTDYEAWIETKKSNTITMFDMGDIRATTLIVYEDIDGEEIL